MGRRASLRALLRRFVIALVALFWVVGGGIGYAIWFANDQLDKADREDLPVTEVSRGEPANFLIIGSDTRSFVDSELEAEQFGDPSEQGGQRSDTMMVLHLDPEAETAFLVSFPRDLWVDVPGEGPAKLNAAYSRGGAKLAVETFQENFDIPINHYLEVNFETFRGLVEAIGSVHLFFPTSAQDTYTGLRIPNPGCIALDGEQALQYVRSRYYEYYDSDGEWKQDPTADIGRIRRQQYFIRSLMSEAIDKGARDPRTALKLIDRAFEQLRMDRELDLTDLYDLYKAFRNTSVDGVEMFTIPADLDRSPDGESILVMRDGDAAAVLDRLRQVPDAGSQTTVERLPDVDPRTVSVGVLNGAGLQGAASDTLEGLVAAGFQRGVAANADRSDYETTVVQYGPGQRDGARLVAAALVAGGDLVEVDGLDFDVVVVVGQDFAGVEAPADSTTDPSVAATSATTVGPPPNPGSTPGVTVPPSEAGRPLVGCG